jgi:hypothetical protein
LAASKDIRKARERLKFLSESSAPAKDKVKKLDKKLADLDKQLVPSNTTQGYF